VLLLKFIFNKDYSTVEINNNIFLAEKKRNQEKEEFLAFESVHPASLGN